MVELLVQAGGSMDITDRFGTSPRRYLKRSVVPDVQQDGMASYPVDGVVK